MISQVLSRLRRAAVADQDGFSARELAVLRELCHGRSNKTIGQYLDLSENTVKFHLKRIFKKLELCKEKVIVHGLKACPLVDVYQLDYFLVVCEFVS